LFDIGRFMFGFGRFDVMSCHKTQDILHKTQDIRHKTFQGDDQCRRELRFWA
jgi:hypothetical protein